MTMPPDRAATVRRAGATPAGDLRALMAGWHRLLVNRETPYALQQPDGSYRWVFQRCDATVLARHLAGECTVAVSSLDEEGRCRWACLDADGPQGRDQLVALRRLLAHADLPALLEGSRRGGHLWLLLEGPTPATLVRPAVAGLLWRARDAGVDVDRIEVYPSGDRPGTLGHAVRLPLGVHRRTGQRYPFLDDAGQPIEAPDLVGELSILARQPLARRADLERLAGEEPSRPDPSPARPVEPGLGEEPSPTGATGEGTTRSTVIRWVDAHVSPLDVLDELAPASAIRRTGQGYLGWCPFHDDAAPQADGSPGTPSFYAVRNRRHGWSWRCLSSNCPHHAGPMRHTFRLFQELLRLDVAGAIQAARVRWPEADGQHATPAESLEGHS